MSRIAKIVHCLIAAACFALATSLAAQAQDVKQMKLSDDQVKNFIAAQADLASWFAWAAAAVVLFATGYYWATTALRTSAAPLIAQLESIEGAVTLSLNGTRRSDLAAGAKLPAGTLILEGESASALLRFNDGTALTLCGDTELEFSDDGQKRLVLKNGTLSVDARPQPAGRPMIVRTQTAEIEVVGTIFSLSADPQATQLSVETGRVRMRRLAYLAEATAHVEAMAGGGEPA